MPSSHSMLHPRTCGWDTGTDAGSSRGAGSREGTVVCSIPGHAWTCGSCVPPRPSSHQAFPSSILYSGSPALCGRAAPAALLHPTGQLLTAEQASASASPSAPTRERPHGSAGTHPRDPPSGAWGCSAPSGFRLVHGAGSGVPVRDGARHKLQHPAGAPALVLGAGGAHREDHRCVPEVCGKCLGAPQERQRGCSEFLCHCTGNGGRFG